MRTQLIIFTLFGILITSIGVSSVFGENGSVIVSTDKPSYFDGDIILVSGEIKYTALGDQLSLIIQAPNGNIVQLDQMTVGSDKKFSTEINPNGPYWKTPGIYEITITQDENNQATISFEFTGVTSMSVNEEVEVEEVEVEEVEVEEVEVEEVEVEEVIAIDSIITATTITIQDSTDLVSYQIVNGKLINVIPDIHAVSLLVYIESIDDFRIIWNFNYKYWRFTCIWRKWISCR